MKEQETLTFCTPPLHETVDTTPLDDAAHTTPPLDEAANINCSSVTAISVTLVVRRIGITYGTSTGLMTEWWDQKMKVPSYTPQ
ncbi:Hypothetical predicted protein [Olea europaea subsp. europaea]|uniref:Uncharacterized protein n=1 Tax=Olea europaea subsp. europaea TaxID=158383 RepID=A0A8S0Q2H0_OLEEU|nr:Hypothetical predicted protein [Olea europaea subsp. europaea]